MHKERLWKEKSVMIPELIHFAAYTKNLPVVSCPRPVQPKKARETPGLFWVAAVFYGRWQVCGGLVSESVHNKLFQVPKYADIDKYDDQHEQDGPEKQPDGAKQLETGKHRDEHGYRV